MVSEAIEGLQKAKAILSEDDITDVGVVRDLLVRTEKSIAEMNLSDGDLLSIARFLQDARERILKLLYSEPLRNQHRKEIDRQVALDSIESCLELLQSMQDSGSVQLKTDAGELLKATATALAVESRRWQEFAAKNDPHTKDPQAQEVFVHLLANYIDALPFSRWMNLLSDGLHGSGKGFELAEALKEEAFATRKTLRALMHESYPPPLISTRFLELYNAAVIRRWTEILTRVRELAAK